MTPSATPLADGFPDLSGLPIARRLHWGRWLAAAAILVVLGLIGLAFAAGQIEWAYVGRFLTVPVIVNGIVNTMVMAVLAMRWASRSASWSRSCGCRPTRCCGPWRRATLGCSAVRR